MSLREFSEGDVLGLIYGEVLPEFTFAGGGRSAVRGWNGFDWENRGTLFREGLREDTPVHGSFDSMREVVDFTRGRGDYSDRNGFFYDEEDLEELYGEGFFNDFQCPECVKENLEADIDGFVDPSIFPAFHVDEVESFKPGEEKYRGEIRYRCDRHPEVYLMRSETWYEDSG